MAQDDKADGNPQEDSRNEQVSVDLSSDLHALREQWRRDAIDAAHFFGLAALYEERGKRQEAVECLEIARRKETVNPFAHKLQGKILFKRKGYTAAAEELRIARRYNPFDRETAEILGRVEYERENYEAAVEATIDAFLLVDDDDRENGNRLKRRIRTLKGIQNLSSQELVDLFHERRRKLQTAFDRLEWQRSRLLRVDESDSTQVIPNDLTGHIELAGKMRTLDIWSNLDDEQIFFLSRAAREEFYSKGDKLFDYGSHGEDIYTLESGKILIRRPTAYGTYNLGTLQSGSVFGEVNFISSFERSGEAVAAEDVSVLRLDARELRILIDKRPDLGVRLYTMFWQGLAHKLRGANEQLRTFFTASPAENFLDQSGANKAKGEIQERQEEKLALLEEHGLSGTELTTLARFSSVRRYESGSVIFREGDQGHEMFAVLEGRVMISKFIAGGGEEALAILDRGDFFGEMSLIDGAPRSADAKAHGGDVALVAFDDTTLKDVLSGDPVTALEFMKLLCRLICQRLREIDEKVTGWNIMSGNRPDETL